MKLAENVWGRTFVIETNPVTNAQGLGEFVLVKSHQHLGNEVEDRTPANFRPRDSDTTILSRELVPTQVAFGDAQIGVQQIQHIVVGLEDFLHPAWHLIAHRRVHLLDRQSHYYTSACHDRESANVAVSQ